MISVDDGAVFRFRDHRIQLTRGQRDIMRLFVSSPERVVTNADICRVTDKPFSRHRAWQHIKRLRRTIMPSGVGIMNWYGVGYVLTIPELPSAALAQLTADGKARRVADPVAQEIPHSA